MALAFPRNDLRNAHWMSCQRLSEKLQVVHRDRRQVGSDKNATQSMT